jgi:protein-tyrosine phosphatase
VKVDLLSQEIVSGRIPQMWTSLYWVKGPWRGKSALASRPRGEDWLEDEIKSWRQAGINTVLSLLEPAEEMELGLKDEGALVKRQGMKFNSLPIPDRQVPNSESGLRAMLEKMDADQSAGDNVVVHCRQGVGRTGLVAACLLVTKGLSLHAGITSVASARGTPIPETDHYAAVLASAE